MSNSGVLLGVVSLGTGLLGCLLVDSLGSSCLLGCSLSVGFLGSVCSCYNEEGLASGMKTSYYIDSDLSSQNTTHYTTLTTPGVRAMLWKSNVSGIRRGEESSRWWKDGLTHLVLMIEFIYDIKFPLLY